MPFSVTNSTIVRAIKEAIFGAVPGTGNPMTLRIVSETLAETQNKATSRAIRPSRISDRMRTQSASTAGGIAMEFYYQGIDPWLEAVMRSTFAVFGTNGVGTAVATAAVTSTTITASVAPTGANAFTNLARGQWFRVIGSGANGGRLLRVSTITAPTATVITLDTNTPGTVSASESLSISSSRLTHGDTTSSYAIEVNNTDSGTFRLYKGQTASKLTAKFAPNADVDFTVDFMGQEAVYGTATALPGTPTAAPNFDYHSGIGNQYSVLWVDGAPLAGTNVMDVTLDFDNSLRSRAALFSKTPIGFGSGEIKATVSFTVYFADTSLATKFQNNADASFILASLDDAGNGYIFTIPSANVTGWATNANGKDTDQMVSVTLTLLEDDGNATPTLRKGIFIDRVGVAVA